MTVELPEPNTEPLGLENLTNGKAPKSRLSDPEKAHALAVKLVDASIERNRRDATVKAQIDGEPPFSHSRLKASAQTWRCNKNFREAKSMIQAANTPYYDLFNGARHLMEIYTSYGGNAFERAAFSEAITEEADEFLKEWDEFDAHMQAMIFERTTYGKGFLYFPDKDSWKFEFIQQHLLHVPDKAKAIGSKVPVCVIKQSYQVHELHQKISNEETAQARGWNVKAVKEAIENAYPLSESGATQDYMMIQQRIKDNDLYEGETAATVQTYHLFVTEFSENGKPGRISHLIVNDPSIQSGKEKPAAQFLYESVGAYESFKDVIARFFFETWDLSWNGATGLGLDVCDTVGVKNRLKCATIDGAFLRAGIHLQATDANSKEKLSLVQIGAMTVLPAGFNVQNSQIMGDLAGPMSVDKMLDMTLSVNTGVYRPKMDRPEGNPRTAREVELNFQASATLSNSAVNRFYQDLDKFYPVLARRLMKDPEFRKRCKARGVPEGAMDKLKCVRACRAVGNGSPYMRTQSLRNIAPLSNMFPEAGRQRWLKDTVSSEMNSDAAKRYVPEPMDESGTSDQAAWATMENGLLKIGSPVLISAGQNDVIHLQTHMLAATGAIESVRQGGNPIEVLNYLEQLGPHMLGHLERLSADETRKEAYKALKSQWDELARATDDLRRTVEQMAQQARADQEANAQADAIAAGSDPEQRRKDAQLIAEQRRKDFIAAESNRRKTEAHNLKLTIQDSSAAADIALKNRQAQQQATEPVTNK